MRNKIAIRFCILILGIVFIGGIVYCYDIRRMMSRTSNFVQAEEKYMNESEFELALWNITEITSEQNGDILIKWWYCQNEDKYYFFIPEKLLQKGMHWMFPDTERVWIDGEWIENGSLCDLKEGCYQVSIELPEEKKNCNMEIRYSSPIGTLFLETQSGSMDYLHESKDNYESGSYTLLAENGNVYYSGGIENIHCRGNASWEDTSKKSYQIKLIEKKDFFHMGEDKQWLLLANAFDNTLLRNTLAFDMAKEFGLTFTPDAKYVDVYANGEYIGNYLLTEKIEIDENRVNINNLEKEMELLNSNQELSECEFFMEQQGRLFSTKGYRIEQQPEDITGGYLLEIEMSDRYGLEASGFITSRMQPVVFSSPKYASYEQVSYIANRYQDFEDAVFSEDGYNPYTGVYFTEYIDMDSFARKYLLEELTKNLDAAFTSQYFYKPVDSVSTKFFAGPAWDYDKAIAASGITENGIDLHDPNGLYAATQTKDSDIWYGLYQQDEFREYVIKIYKEELEVKVRLIAKDRVAAYADMVMDSAMNNAIRWQVFSEASTIEEKMVMYKEKVAELSVFLNNRLDFLNQEWSVQK